MEARLNLTKVAPKGAYQAMAALQQYVDTCGLERPLLELVKIRASQINGCAYCIDMHTQRRARPRRIRAAHLHARAPGAKAPFTPTASARPSNGPKQSR